MTIIEYLEDTRQALRISMADPVEEEEENQGEEESFLSLPELSIGDLDADNDTGLPQGSDNTTHQGAGLLHAAASGQSAGTEVITAQTGGNPG